MNASRVKNALQGVCLLTLAYGTALATEAVTNTNCTNQSAYPYPKAAQLVNGWRSKQLPISAATAKGVLQDFCVQANNFALEKNIETERIDAASNVVLSKFIASELDDAAERPTMSAYIRAEFGASGFARPVFKKTARLMLTYVGSVDAIKADGEYFPRVPMLLLLPGQVHIEGLNDGKTVCASDILLKPKEVYQYTCDSNKH